MDTTLILIFFSDQLTPSAEYLNLLCDECLVELRTHCQDNHKEVRQPFSTTINTGPQRTSHPCSKYRRLQDRSLFLNLAPPPASCFIILAKPFLAKQREEKLREMPIKAVLA
jgi:hypothetical protein